MRFFFRVDFGFGFDIGGRKKLLRFDTGLSAFAVVAPVEIWHLVSPLNFPLSFDFSMHQYSQNLSANSLVLLGTGKWRGSCELPVAIYTALRCRFLWLFRTLWHKLNSHAYVWVFLSEKWRPLLRPNYISLTLNQ